MVLEYSIGYVQDTCEPMLNMGTARIAKDKNNGWTIYTYDGNPSDQWDIVVFIAQKGNEVLAY